MGNRWGNSVRLYFFGLQNHYRWWLQPWNLKMLTPWKESYDQPAAAAAKSLQLCPTLCDPIDSSPSGSPVPGILQATTLERVAISFSNAWKGKVKVKSLSRVRLLATPWTAAYQAPPSMGFSRQEHWSGVPSLSPISRGKRQIVRILKSHLLVHQNIDQYPVLSDAQAFHCTWPDCPGGKPAAAVSRHGPEGPWGRGGKSSCHSSSGAARRPPPQAALGSPTRRLPPPLCNQPSVKVIFTPQLQHGSPWKQKGKHRSLRDDLGGNCCLWVMVLIKSFLSFN